MTPEESLTHNRLQEPLAQQLVRLKDTDWWPLLKRWHSSPQGQALVQAVDARQRADAVVFPSNVFRALALTPRARVRVLILGQDPYHGPGQAEGLAFSVPAGQPCPPSLRNIFKELQRDLGQPPPPVGRYSLLPWAQQGVLLLNASLTVEKGQAASHSALGWHALTDAICAELMESLAPVVFMLWGAHAQASAKNWAKNWGGNWGGNWGKNGAVSVAGHQAVRVDQAAHRHGAAALKLLLFSNHPSPLSALRGPQPFLGCGHFGRANAWLQANGAGSVQWQLR